MEQWKDIKGFPLYQISDLGNVYSKYKKGLLKTRLDKHGYEVVNLYNNKKMFTIKIHRLVLGAFDPRENDEELLVNHKDGKKTNNKLKNLEWCSNLENSIHAVAIGLIETTAVMALDPKSLKVVHEYSSTRAAEIDGFQHSNISACINGKRKTHKGFIWRIKEEV